MEYNRYMINLSAAVVPYIAVLVGMLIFKSAWLAILLYHLGIVGFLMLRRPRDLVQKLFAGWNHPLTLPAVITCAMAAPVVVVLWPLLRGAETILPEWMAQYGLIGGAWLLMIPYFSIVHPLLEEVHWRQSDPAEGQTLHWGDLLFAGYHVLVLHHLLVWPGLLLVFVILAASSVFWRWSVKRSGGYAVAILTHAAADAGVVAGVYFLLR